MTVDWTKIQVTVVQTDSSDSGLDRFKWQGIGQIQVTVDWTDSGDI